MPAAGPRLRRRCVVLVRREGFDPPWWFLQVLNEQHGVAPVAGDEAAIECNGNHRANAGQNLIDCARLKLPAAGGLLEFKLPDQTLDMPVIELGQRHESELRCQYVSLKYEPVLLSGSFPESGKLLQVLADKIADGLDSRCALVGSPAAPWEPTNRIKTVCDYLSFDFLEFRAPKSAIGTIVIEARGFPVTAGP